MGPGSSSATWMKVFCATDMRPEVDGVGGSRNIGSSFTEQPTMGVCSGGGGISEHSSNKVWRTSEPKGVAMVLPPLPRTLRGVVRRVLPRSIGKVWMGVADAHGDHGEGVAGKRPEGVLASVVIGVLDSRTEATMSDASRTSSAREASGEAISSMLSGLMRLARLVWMGVADAHGDHGEGVAGKRPGGVLASVVIGVLDGRTEATMSDASRTPSAREAFGVEISSMLSGLMRPARLRKALCSPSRLCGDSSSSLKQPAKIRRLRATCPSTLAGGSAKGSST
mmetsp:Transcript_80663/g.260691  ORF Transcript_80663/g.260691 Transcript_80663/m.260691 type:complete len:281 (-) Transcript_80663:1139-1981(-)